MRRNIIVFFFIYIFFLFNSLLLNAGKFTNVQEPMGSGQGVKSPSIAYGDYDNDGDLDVALTGYEGVANYRFIIYRNDAGVFTNVQEPMGANQGVYESSIAFGDYDNDGDLDIALTGDDNIGSDYRFIIYRNDAGVFTNVQEPMGTNKGVYASSIAFGDYDYDYDYDYDNDGDNDGDLDIALTGDGGNHRFIIFRNDETNVNNTPSVPEGMSAIDSGGYWRFQWNQSSDDHTPVNILRYKIAIGINTSGLYDYSSTVIDYPRGQANIGNVCIVAGTSYYQSTIPITKTVYWKVCAIDSAFKHSDYCSEQKASPQTSEEDLYTINDVVLVPNPFNPYKSKKDYITFFNAPDDIKIKIYNILGDKLVKLASPNSEHQIKWYGKDSSGRSLPRGLYIARLEDSKGNTRHIKFVIHR